MENPLWKKLHIKPSQQISAINAPETAAAIFRDIPNSIDFHYQFKSDSAVFLLFVATHADLNTSLALAKKLISSSTIIWLFYPQVKSKLTSGLSLMKFRPELLELNLVIVASAAVNETWTAVRLKVAGTEKKSGTSNVEIAKNDYGQYIDVQHNVVSLPDDLKEALTRQPNLLHKFFKLSYAQQKDYVLSVITAKKEITRQGRILKVIAGLTIKN